MTNLMYTYQAIAWLDVAYNHDNHDNLTDRSK